MTSNATVPRDELSQTMKEAIVAIAKDPDGQVIPTGGGLWRTNEERAPFGTKTIYALNDRGLLDRQYTSTKPHKDVYKLTAKGYGEAGKLRSVSS